MTLLSMRGVSKRYGGVQALSDIDLDISAGAFMAVIGPNGAGKSTLLNVMTRLLAPLRSKALTSARCRRIASSALASAEFSRTAAFSHVSPSSKTSCWAPP
jgi:branched-chain amino acid transport system ATP-binding protein